MKTENDPHKGNGMPAWGYCLASFAIRDLAEAVGQRQDCTSFDITRHIKSALKHQAELLSMFVEPVPWEEKESSLSRIIHTFLRKYDDSAAGAIVYRMVDRGQGMLAWRGFIYVLVNQKATRSLWGNCMSSIDNLIENGDESDEIMALAIKAWLPDKESLQTVMENCCPEKLKPL